MMEVYTRDEPLDIEGAALLTLLATCESVLQILRKNLQGEKAHYYLDRMDRDIEGINRQLNGYLPDEFIAKAHKYHEQQQALMMWLLDGYDALPEV